MADTHGMQAILFLTGMLADQGCSDSAGRFFAASELKLILAHLVLRYDIKLVEEGKRPANFFLLMGTNPNMYGKVMLRTRRSD